MTPERWRRINDLFEAALRIDPSERDDWLHRACDADLRDVIVRLLANDERVRREGFLSTARRPASAADPAMVSSPPIVARDSETLPDVAAGTIGFGEGGFTPKKAIAAGAGSDGTSDLRELLRARLRTVALIHLLLVGLLPLWRITALRQTDPAVAIGVGVVLAGLGGIFGRLSYRRSLSLANLRLLELGMIGILAGLLAVAQYRVMLKLSLRGNTFAWQLVMQNVVLATSILILCFGLYVPKSGRRAALVVGPIALVPFATLLVLSLRQPEAVWSPVRRTIPPVQLGVDAMLLLILVAGSVQSAQAVDRLRREVVEARQLGQYRLGRRVGSGGMGEVYLAEHRLLKRPCALKLIRPGATADPQALERFEREVRLTATLSHVNIIEVYDYGRTEDGTYYYVMPYVPGLSLAELVRRDGPPPPARVVYLLRQVCRALGAAHAAGLIHRDIKPANILVGQIGGMPDMVKLLDFGLVRAVVAAEGPRLTLEGWILGTPSFMSPEQASGDQGLDERSDLYSLGAVGYYLLTGQPPFPGEDIIRVMMSHVSDPVVPPSEVQDGIPEDLERVVLRCLAKHREERFPDAGSLERALAECRCSDQWSADLAAQCWLQPGAANPATQPAATLGGMS